MARSRSAGRGSHERVRRVKSYNVRRLGLKDGQ
jgi:hypothetical protein